MRVWSRLIMPLTKELENTLDDDCLCGVAVKPQHHALRASGGCKEDEFVPCGCTKKGLRARHDRCTLEHVGCWLGPRLWVGSPRKLPPPVWLRACARLVGPVLHPRASGAVLEAHAPACPSAFRVLFTCSSFHVLFIPSIPSIQFPLRFSFPSSCALPSWKSSLHAAVLLHACTLDVSACTCVTVSSFIRDPRASGDCSSFPCTDLSEE